MTTEQITPEQIATFRQQRVHDCRNELMPIVRAVLEKHNCNMIAVPQLTEDGRTIATIQIVSRD